MCSAKIHFVSLKRQTTKQIVSFSLNRETVKTAFSKINFFSFDRKTVTRGVNKSVEGDFKSSITRQVQRSHESVYHLIASFLKNEKNAILSAII